MARPGSVDTDEQSPASAAVYVPWILKYVYDKLVLGLYSSWAWRCPVKVMQAFFNENVTELESPRLCDIGVGTGYYLTRAPLKTGSDISLVDVNPNCLALAHERITTEHKTLRCRKFQQDVYADSDQDDKHDAISDSPPAWTKELLTAAGGPFDVISVMYLLHCLPGPVKRKAELLRQLSLLLEPQKGVLFGATILGKGVRHNLFGRFLMRRHNARGIFDNWDDDAATLVAQLKAVFDIVEWRVEGTVLLFKAMGPIRVE